MNLRKLVFPFIVTMTFAGASLAADGALRMKGKITDPKGMLFGVCRIELFIPTDKMLLSVYEKVIDAYFDFSIPGPATREKYVVDLSCRDAKNGYRSDPVMIGGETTTDFGHVVLERR